MQTIDFEWFRSFVEVYRQHSISRAALARDVTQPTISQHIAALEKALDQTLFERLPRKMHPTDAGKLLYQQVVRSIEQLEQVVTTQAPNAEILELRIGGPHEFLSTIILPVLRDLPYRITCHFDLTPRLLDMLQQQELDIVFSTQNTPIPGIAYQALYEEEYVLVAAPAYAEQHPAPINGLLEDNLDVWKSWLESLSWLSYGHELPIIRRFWQQHFNERPSLVPQMVIPNLLTIQRLLELGKGVSLLPIYLCRQALRKGRLVVLVESEEPTVNQLWQAMPETSKHLPLLRNICQTLRSKRAQMHL